MKRQALQTKFRHQPVRGDNLTFEDTGTRVGAEFISNWRQYVVTIVVATLVAAVLVSRYKPEGNVDSSIQGAINNIEDTINKVKEEVDSAKKECGELPVLSDIDNEVRKLHTETLAFRKLLASFESKRDDLDKLVSEHISETTRKLSDKSKDVELLDQEIRHSKENVESNLAEESRHVKDMVKNSEKSFKIEMESHFKVLKNELNELKTEGEDITKRFENIKETDESVQIIRQNALNKGLLVNILLFLMVAVVGLILSLFVVCQRLSRD